MSRFTEPRLINNKLFFTLIGLWLTLTTLVYSQESRHALLIGNSEYQHKPKLPNAVNDILALETALESVGFQVTTKANVATKTRLKQ